MKSVLFSVVAVFLGFSAGWLAGSLQGGPHPQALRADPDWVRFSSRLIREPAGRSFDAVVHADQTDAANEAAVRVYVDAVEVSRPDVAKPRYQYLAFEITPMSAVLLAVEAGAYREIARADKPTGGQADRLPQTIRVKRRAPAIELVCDGKTVLRSHHPGFGRGRVGVGTVPGVSVRGPFVQPVDTFVVTDDFMRGPQESSQWTKAGEGHWEVRSLDNPGRSSNAFVYQAWGEAGGVSLLGRPYWDAYRAAVSVLGDAGGAVGLVVAASAPSAEGGLPDRYALIRWEAQTDARPADPEAGPAGGAPVPRLALLEVTKGEERCLASCPGGYRPGQWYRLEATLADGCVRVFVDGRELLEAESPWFSGGRAGLYARSKTPTEFDDFRAVSLQATGTSSILHVAWQTYGGPWRRSEVGLACQPSPAHRVLAVTGRDAWANLLLATRIEADGFPAAFGLVAGFRDPGNFLAYRVRPAALAVELIAVRQGEETVLAAGPLPSAPEDLWLSVDRGYVAAPGIAAFVPALQPGRVGIFVEGPDGTGVETPCTFTSFSAASVEPPRPVVSINEIFDEERLMKIWSGTAGDWKGNRKSAGVYERAFWHRALFYGDTAIEALLPSARRTTWKAALSLAKPVVSETANNGYVLLLKHEDEEQSLQLIRQGEEVHAETLEEGAPCHRLRFRRAGPFLLGYVDDHLRLTWQDPAPLTDPKVAWAAKGIDIEPENVQIYSKALLDYSFNRAAADWRRAGGVWEVTNRWECDPRWSFMAGTPPSIAQDRIERYEGKLTPEARWKVASLKHQIELLPDRTSKLAALWHKGLFEGDFVFECFVGPMHRHGVHYRQGVKNFCLTVCGDGKDLASGYNCIFGGWDNTKSAILRDGEVVEERHTKIPVRRFGNIHRMWFRVRVERRGAEIRFSVYTQPRNDPHKEQRLLFLSFEDGEPLPGRRMAIWTYDAGLLVARCRVSCAGLAGMEDPFAPVPVESSCIYTRPTD